MCRLGSYFAAFVAGVLFTLTMDVLARPSATGLVGGARPVQQRSAVSQIVNRRHKTDRLMQADKTTHDIAPSGLAPARSRPVPLGCDPAFSPLLAGARLNYPTHCIVDNTIGPTIVVLV